jgi:hypothetical protein
MAPFHFLGLLFAFLALWTSQEVRAASFPKARLSQERSLNFLNGLVSELTSSNAVTNATRFGILAVNAGLQCPDRTTCAEGTFCQYGGGSYSCKVDGGSGNTCPGYRTCGSGWESCWYYFAPFTLPTPTNPLTVQLSRLLCDSSKDFSAVPRAQYVLEDRHVT